MDELNFREYLPADNAFVSEGLCAIETLEKNPLTSLATVDNFAETISGYLSKISQQPATLIIIAEKNNQPCGFAIGIVEPQSNPFTSFNMRALIQAVWVKPDCCRKGIGKSLVEELLASFSEFEVPYCDLAYHPNNKTAQKFWENLGFTNAQITARKFL